MPHHVGLDVSLKTTAICVVDEQGRSLWRGACATDPGAISARVWRHAGVDVKVGIETGSMTPWLVHVLRSAGLVIRTAGMVLPRPARRHAVRRRGRNATAGRRWLLPWTSKNQRMPLPGAGIRRMSVEVSIVMITTARLSVCVLRHLAGRSAAVRDE